ncbi:MAG: zinc ribbon domain-containing protein [Candidatus Pelethousia sp.]|nr:zinc ribbon domain-containing protein [Candidatus Pelethousia sp.]
MGFFNRLLQGRYGVDKLNLALFWGGIGCSVVTWFLSKVPVLFTAFRLLALIFYGYAVFRIFSRNYAARQRELTGYLRLENKLRALWQRLRYGHRNVINLNAERKKFKYLTCPQCRQKLRVPRGKGKLRVTCTKCGCKFNAKS